MYVILSLIAIFIIGIIWARNSEKKEWNNGICKEDGTKWKHFDNDSQGGRGYVCENKHRTWISYSVDKIK